MVHNPIYELPEFQVHRHINTVLGRERGWKRDEGGTEKSL